SATVFRVVDHENPPFGLAGSQRHDAARRTGERDVRGRRQRNLETKAGAVSELGIDAEIAAHDMDVFARDRETEPGPLVRTGARYRLDERLKQPRLILRRDPGSRVLDLELRTVVAVRRAECDAAQVGELDRVPEQVDEDLAELPFVTAHDRRDRPGRFHDEIEATIAGREAEHLLEYGNEVLEIEVADAELRLPYFDLRNRQHVI